MRYGNVRRFDLSVVLAVLMLFGLVGMLTLVSDTGETATTEELEPESVPLRAAVLACPDVGTIGDLLVSSVDPDATGEVTVGGETKQQQLSLPLQGLTRFGDDKITRVRARGDVASAIVAGRVRDKTGELIPCRPMVSQQYYTSVGAIAGKRTKVQLVNTDPGVAVVDIAVYGPDGALEAPRLRGMTIAGRSRDVLYLDKIVPSRDTLSVSVTVTRGRAGVAVRDTVQEIGGPPRRDWIPAQTRPRTKNYLMGVPTRSDNARITMFNPGDSESVASVKVVARDSEFAADDAKEIRVPANSTVTTDVSRLLKSQRADGLDGLVVESTEPLVAGIEVSRGKDLIHAAGAAQVTDAATVVPESDGANSVVLAGATAEAAVEVELWDKAGKQLKVVDVELPAQAARSVKLPRGTRVVRVRVEGGGEIDARLLTTNGNQSQVTPLTPRPSVELVPQVQSGPLEPVSDDR